MQEPRKASGHLRRVHQTRGDSWEVKVRPPHGKQFTKVIGRVWTKHTKSPEGYLTKGQAESVLRGMLVEADHGRLAIQQAVGVTFGQACNEWLRYIEHDRQRRASTLRDYRSTVNSVLVPHFKENTSLSTITAATVDGFREDRLHAGKSAATINKQLRILHGIFKRAIRVYGLRENPANGVERQPKIESGDFNVLTANEVMALACAAPTEQEAALYIVAAFTGLRMGELRALEWQDVDRAKRNLHIRRSYTNGGYSLPKSGKVRSVPMVDHVVKALDDLSKRERYTGGDCLVFCNTVGGILDDSKMRKRYTAALKIAGLTQIRFHDLRHTFGTIAVQAFPLSDVKAYMGHSDIATTMRYVHHVPRHDAADKLSRLISENATSGFQARKPDDEDRQPGMVNHPPELPPDMPHREVT